MSDNSEKLLGGDQGVVLAEEDDAHVDFGTFIISLGHSAYIAMGMADHPDGKNEAVNVSAAKELIDILEMLEKKTKGNLEQEEIQMLSGLLYELRIAYVNLD